MLDLTELMKTIDKEESTCKGRIYRYKDSAYINARGDWCAKQSMVLMKRMSCSGCVACGGLIDLLEQLCYPEDIIFPDNLKTDGLYILSLEEHESGGWDCPEVSCYPKFIEYKEYTVKVPAPIKQINATFEVKFDEEQ